MSRPSSRDIEDAVLDRRTFLSGGIAAGAVLASKVALGFAKPLVPATAGAAATLTEGTGHIDDICGHCPPYSHPIPYGSASASASTWEHWDPIDRNFMV